MEMSHKELLGKKVGYVFKRKIVTATILGTYLIDYDRPSQTVVYNIYFMDEENDLISINVVESDILWNHIELLDKRNTKTNDISKVILGNKASLVGVTELDLDFDYHKKVFSEKETQIKPSKIAVMQGKIEFYDSTFIGKTKRSIEFIWSCILTFLWFQKRSWNCLFFNEAILGFDKYTYPAIGSDCIGVNISKTPLRRNKRLIKTW